MRKIYLLLAGITLLCSYQVKAQDSELRQKRRCFAAEALDQFLRNNPGAETIGQFESWLSQKIAERKTMPHTELVTPVVTLPVVFHIIHDNEAVGSGRNLPQGLIQQQVLQLNKDFSNLSNSTYAVSEDMGIRFALAQNDPTGIPLAEPGIDRIDRVAKGWTAPPYTVGYASASDYLTTTIKPNSIWDPTRYINIWVSEWEAGILGIATFPTGSGLSGLSGSETNSTAGVTIDYTTVGSLFFPQGCDSYGKGRTLTHELGHFFGLRHIWGDANCGDDFCGDTPVHTTSNSGEPVHPKPNACGTADEMFENYMDYSDDIITNTFTVNQGDRMEAVMANSPRRVSLATSNAGLVMVNASNAISFADCDGALSLSEKGLVSTCPRYRDVSLELNAENKATATTTVTFNLGGTAVNGRDYQLLTPSVTFNAGDDYKAAVVRILDNAVADGSRTIILSYSIGSGGGVVAGASAQSMTITIADDDYNAQVNQTTPSTVTLMSQDFGTTTGSNQIPAGWSSTNSGTATNKWVANPTTAGTYGFAGNTAHISNGAATAVTNGTAAIAYTKTTTTDARLTTSSVNTSGLKNIKLSFDYVCNGEADYDFGVVYYSINGTSFSILLDQYGGIKFFETVSTLSNYVFDLPVAANGAANLSFRFRWLSDNSTGTNPPFAIDNVIVTGERQTIESQLAHTSTENIRSGTDNYFYSTNDGQLLARLNNSNQSVGCVTASVQAAGAGNTAIISTGGNGFRSNKIIRVTPSVANTSASYQLTLYFTTAEMAGWLPAEIPTLKVMKLVNGAYTDNNYSAADGHVLTTAFSDQSANGYYTYTATVTDGFSDFMLVSSNIVLPVNLLNFEAIAQKANIDLNWSTSQESNSKGFAVERCTDGINFEKIGWVDGHINAGSRSDYSFTDNFVQPGVVYYYRLGQTDLDGKQKISEIRQAKITKSGLNVTISPNPAKDQVGLFIFGNTQPADLDLINAQGQIVKSWRKISTPGAPINLAITGLPAGIYIVHIQLPGEKIVRKLVIE